TPYQYDVAYADTSGLIGSQRHLVRQDGLATVHSRYYSDAPTTGWFSRYGLFAAQENWGVLYQQMKVPRRETGYLTGHPAVLWSDSYDQTSHDLAGPPAAHPP